jgi:hypothetical protein
MDNTSAVSPNLSLSALRGAVGGVVGAADDLGCWDRVVSIWRIFWALDGLMAVLWAIVDRLRAGEVSLGGGCPAGTMAVLGERPGIAGLRRVRAVAGVRAVSGRRVLAGAVASVGRVRRFSRARMEWRGRVLVGISPVLAVRCRLFSELGWGLSRNCTLFVTR